MSWDRSSRPRPTIRDVAALSGTSLNTASRVEVGAMRAVRRLDLHRRVALVGFDDFPLSDLVEPPVTVVAQDPATIGREAAAPPFARLDGDRSPTQHHLAPTTIITRRSDEIPPTA